MTSTVRRVAGSISQSDQITVDATRGKLMRQRRKYIGLSRKGLAKNLGLTRRDIKQYERGKIHFGVDMVVLLRLALKVRIGFFADPITPIARKAGVRRG